MSRQIVALVILSTLAFALLDGCGGASSRTTPAKRTIAHAKAARQSSERPTYSAAKRRYLANFKTDCAAASSGADSSARLIQQLVDEIGKGNIKAVPELVVYLDRLAESFEGSLTQARRFGVPPNPGSEYGRAYFTDSSNVIAAIRALSKAIVRIEAKGIGTAVQSLKSATSAAESDGKRYGMPLCPSEHTHQTNPLQIGPAI